jgi:hypothetical protein
MKPRLRNSFVTSSINIRRSQVSHLRGSSCIGLARANLKRSLDSERSRTLEFRRANWYAYNRFTPRQKRHAGAVARYAVHHRRRILPFYDGVRIVVARVPRPIYSCASSDRVLRRYRHPTAGYGDRGARLTKMNWNSSEGSGRYPITLSFAKKVGILMAELPEEQIPNPSCRFYM